MSHSDELRILAEMGTFTQGDLAYEIKCSTQWASVVFAQLQRERVIERVRVGTSWLYALTERGRARVAKMPAIDPEERCMLLEWVVDPSHGFFVPPCPNCGCPGTGHVWTGNDGAYGVWRCTGCGDLNRWIDADDDIPF